MKEFKHNFQNIPAAACWQGGGVGARPNSVHGLSFHLSHDDTESMLLKKLSDAVKET